MLWLMPYKRIMKMLTIVKRVAVLLSLVVVAGCASIDYDYPKSESRYLADTGDTYLARSLAPEVAKRSPDQSGFVPLRDGVDALAARLLLADQAEKTIDVQYYLIKNDLVGRVFIRSLLQAADRGVRVRIMLDDVFTKGYDAGMTALDSHPNIQIRILNPFYRGAAGKVVSGLTAFGRINRRMHNKSFTVDHQVTIIGGRNIADEYFGAREDSKFSDLDVLGIGPIVSDVSTVFDDYWNHETALPTPAFIRGQDTSAAAVDRYRDALDEALNEATNSRYAKAVEDRIIEQLEAGGDQLSAGPLTHWSPIHRTKAFAAGPAKRDPFWHRWLMPCWPRSARCSSYPRTLCRGKTA